MRSPSRLLLIVPWMALGILCLVTAWILAYEAWRAESDLTNILINAFALILVFTALAIALKAVEEEVQRGEMQPRTLRLLYWLPRVVALLFTAFLSIFALDVFGQGYGFWGTLLALIMHLLPVGVLLIGILLAWRWEWIGAVFLGSWAVWYVIMAWGQFLLSIYFVLAALPLTMGLLFLLNWLYRAELHHRPQATV